MENREAVRVIREAGIGEGWSSGAKRAFRDIVAGFAYVSPERLQKLAEQFTIDYDVAPKRRYDNDDEQYV